MYVIMKAPNLLLLLLHLSLYNIVDGYVCHKPWIFLFLQAFVVAFLVAMLKNYVIQVPFSCLHIVLGCASRAHSDSIGSGEALQQNKPAVPEQVQIEILCALLTCLIEPRAPKHS